MDNRYVKIFASGSKAPLKATPGPIDHEACFLSELVGQAFFF